MANVRITELPVLSTMTDAAVMPVVAGNVTQQISGTDLKTYFGGGNGVPGGPTYAIQYNAGGGAFGGTANLTTDGGNINLTGSISAAGNVELNGNVYAAYVQSSGNISAAGNITGANIITSGTSGNITGANVISANVFALTPGGGTITKGIIPAYTSLTGNTIVLTPDGGTSADQQLVVYPTAGVDANHLHLTSGNLYNTELFLGDDFLYVKLANTGNIVINSNNNAGNSAQWSFSPDGGYKAPILTAAPTTPVTGTYYTADGYTWNPASKIGGIPYPVFYDGAVYNALY